MLTNCFFSELVKFYLLFVNWSDYSNSIIIEHGIIIMENLTQLFIDAGTLMLAGMVFVFAFLGLLIIFINQVLVKLAIKFPDPVNQNSRKKAKVKTSEQDGVSPQIVAAISSAVSQYRQKHNNKE